MDFNEYQRESAKFATYPTDAVGVYPLLGLIEEVGEVAEKLLAIADRVPDNGSQTAQMLKEVLKRAESTGRLAGPEAKQLRKGIGFEESDKEWCSRFRGELFATKQEALLKEFGDVLWFMTKCLDDLNTTLGDIAENNINKLAGRLRRGTIQGSGDDR